MSGDFRRQIIEAVARGELTPAEAATQLESTTPDSASGTVQPDSAATPLTAVRVTSDFGSVRVVGDPTVAGAVAEGPHEAEQDGSTLVIRTYIAGGGGFVFGRRGRIRVNMGGRGHDDRIEVRMNPRLALELDVKAGDIRVDGVEGPLRANVMAGDVRIDRFRSPIQLDVKAGQVRARGRLDRGESRVRCSAGQVRIELESGSSVRVRASARLGSVDLAEGSEMVGIGGSQERVIGGGAALLDLEATMGQVEVRADA